MMTKTVVQVWSDNFDGEYLTFEAYSELRLQMSTGDFGTHKYVIREVFKDEKILGIQDLLNDEDFYQEFKKKTLGA